MEMDRRRFICYQPSQQPEPDQAKPTYYRSNRVFVAFGDGFGGGEWCTTTTKLN